MDITIQDMLDMPLHEHLKVDGGTCILRVPGGWIYEILDDYDNNSPETYTRTFVPEPAPMAFEVLRNNTTQPAIENVVDVKTESIQETKQTVQESKHPLIGVISIGIGDYERLINGENNPINFYNGRWSEISFSPQDVEYHEINTKSDMKDMLFDMVIMTPEALADNRSAFIKIASNDYLKPNVSEDISNVFNSATFQHHIRILSIQILEGKEGNTNE